MSRTTPELRQLWKTFECAQSQMVEVPFGPDRIRVAPPTADAWKALASVIAVHGYLIRTEDTDSYNCRTITGGAGKSLHSYGIALDVNWKTNPYLKAAGKVKFSNKPTQSERALDVKRQLAHTDMTPDMIADVRKIQTNAGVRVFEWGGDWTNVKDSMHFELDLSPDELQAGIDWSTVAGGGVAPASTSTSATNSRFRVIARSGLRLRLGPGTEFGSNQLLAFGTPLWVLGTTGDWALVDLQGDGAGDGHVHRSYLTPA